MKSLLLISILLFICGCNTIRHSNLNKVEEKQLDKSALYSCFKKKFYTALYKSNFSFYKHQLGGLLLIKHMPDNTYRINLVTEVGLKIFDFELKEENVNVVYCIEKMNKKSFIKILGEIFTLLLLENKLDHKTIFFREKKTDEKVYYHHQKKRNTYYYVDNDSLKLNKILDYGVISRKTTIVFSRFYNDIPYKIDIAHRNPSLNISLVNISK